jgi:predicted RNA-binding Zn ribbon-like protein
MPTAPRPLTWGPDSPFKYVAGEASLDLVNTATWSERGLLNDRFTDYGRVVEWAAGAGVVGRAGAARLRRAAAEHPSAARSACASTRALRSALQELYAAVTAGGPLDAPLRGFHPWLAEAHAHLRLDAPTAADRREGRALRWAWDEEEGRLDALLWPVVRGAAELLASGEGARIRMCGGEECGWVYVDRSRNGLRRWCEMETCGTRAKSIRRAERSRA